MFGNGDGVAQDDAEATRWFLLAAAQGDAIAQCNLGNGFALGRGVAQDYTEAMRWYQLAAAQGYADAQFNLGVMFAKGQGVAQDYAEAMRWHRLAAAQGYADSQCNLGFMFENGQGVAQDDAESVLWYRLAAVQEHPCATAALKRLGAVHCMDGDYPEISIDKDTQDLCNHFFPKSCCQNLRWRFLKFAAGCSMTQSPNDVLSFVPR
jgi:TPR repeat protein